MSIKTFLKPLSFLPAIFLMYMIFSFSAQEGVQSASLSHEVSTVVVRGVNYVFDVGLDADQVDRYATKIEFVVRKLAHMTEYFLLAIAVSFPLYVYGLRGFLLMLTVGIICVGFAASDEYHQSFVAGRGPSIKDVGIDSFGVFWGIILVRIVGWTGRKTIFRSDPEQEAKKQIRKERRRMEQELEDERLRMRVEQRRYRKEMKRQTVQTDDPMNNNRQSGQIEDPYVDDIYMNGSHEPHGYSYDDNANVMAQPHTRRDRSDNYSRNRRYDEPDNYSRNRHYDELNNHSHTRRYDEPDTYARDRHYDEPELSDELSDDMPLSHLFRPKK